MQRFLMNEKEMKIGCVKKLKLSFLTHPTTCSRRLNAAVLPPGKPKNNGIEGKTDQARIKNAGTLTGIFEEVLKNSN